MIETILLYIGLVLVIAAGFLWGRRKISPEGRRKVEVGKQWNK